MRFWPGKQEHRAGDAGIATRRCSWVNRRGQSSSAIFAWLVMFDKRYGYPSNYQDAYRIVLRGA